MASRELTDLENAGKLLYYSVGITIFGLIALLMLFFLGYTIPDSILRLAPFIAVVIITAAWINVMSVGNSIVKKHRDSDKK